MMKSLTKRINSRLNHDQQQRSYRYRPNKTTSEVPEARPRPTMPKRSSLPPPIPFLEDLKSLDDAQESISLFHHYQQTGFKHDYPSYASLIYRLARARHLHSAEPLLRDLQLRRIPCQETLFLALFRHYGKLKMTDKALHLFHNMPRFNVHRTVQSFNALLNVLVDNHCQDLVDGLLRGSKDMGFRFNVVSFNILIKMWLHKGDLEKAHHVFVEMMDKGIQPSVVSYNCLIGFLCRRGDVDQAKRLLEDMGRKRIKANHVTYALFMEGYCLVGKFQEAKKLMFDMEYQGCKATPNNYAVLMTDLAKRGLIDDAKDLLDEMKKRRIKPDVAMYNILVSWFVKNDRPGEAYKVLVEMQISGHESKPNAATYRMVIDGFCKTGEYQEALKILNAMLVIRHVPREETFCSLIKGLIKNEQVEDAYFVLREMEERKISPDVGSWEALVTVSIATNST